jgi:hypothetical protein
MTNGSNQENNKNHVPTSNLENEVSLLKQRLASQIMEQDELDFSNIAEFVPAKKAAALLGISLPTLYKFARTGLLQKHNLGSKTFYKRSELMKAYTIKSDDSTNR